MDQSELNQPSEALAVNHDAGSEDAAAAAFEQRVQQPNQDEAEPDAEPGDEPAEEVEETDEPEADADAAEELEEVEYEGKTYKVPPELQKALLRQADYSRNMNEVGAQKKALTEKLEVAERYAQGAEKFAEVLADVRGIDAQLKQFEAVNWQQLRTENPGEYAALAADMQTLRLEREQRIQRAQGVNAEIEQAKQRLLADQREAMDKTLAKELKGWGNELGTKITQYALAQGYQQQDLATVTDPKWVIAMDKARRFDELQAAKINIKAKAQAAPAFVKPGSPRKADPRSDVMVRLKADNSAESAEAAFHQRFK